MAINKITYDAKVAINIDSTIPDINKCNASDLNEIKSVVNNNADEMTNYVKNTDYASSIKSGVIYAEPQNGFMVGPTGKPYTPIMPYNNYSSLPNTYFISKGTLENVITGKGLIDKNVNDLTNYTKTSDLSSVATSGSYNDLTDTPIIPSISDSYGTSTTDGYSQNYINTNTLNPSGEPSTSETDVSSATFTNTLEAPMNIDLKGNTLQNGTPTPSSPIPINNVSGDNDIVVCGKNMLGIADKPTTTNLGLTYSITNNEITINGKTTSEGRIILEKLITPIVLDSSKTYKLSQVSSGTASPDTFSIQLRTDNSNVVVQTFRSLSANAETISNISETITYIGLYIANNTQFTNVKIKWQLEENSSATTYEAYNGTTYNIDLPVENLLNITNKTETVNDVVCKYENGTITLNGTCSSNGFFVLNLNTPLPSGNYSLSANNEITTSADTIIRLDANNTGFQVKLNNANASYSGTYNATISTLAIRLNNGTQYSNFTFKPQLEKGLKVNSYTPYGTTPIELNKIGTYQDYIYKENDKWYLHKEVGKVVLDGSEDYVLASTYTNNTRFTCNSSKAMLGKTTPLLSNYFVDGTGGTDTTNIDTNGSTGQLMITIPNSIATTTNALQTWLSTHNTIVYYVLATPTNTEITYTTLIEQLESIKNAMSKEGTTNVNQVNNDAPFMLDLSVFNDTYNGRYENLVEQIPNNDNLVNVGTYVNDNYKVNMLYSHNLLNLNVLTIGTFTYNDTGTRITTNNYIGIEFITTKPNTNYTFNATLPSKYTSLRYVQFDSSKTFISRSNAVYFSNGSASFTTGNNCYYIAILCYKTTTNASTSDLVNPMLNEGPTALPYEPYITPSINIDREEIYSKPVVLWKNSSPTSDFVSTSITMPSDFTTNYNYYEILYFSGTNKARAFSTGKIIVGSGTNLSYDVALEDSATPTIRYREANYNSTNNAITIGNGRQKAYNSTTGTANNGICIPYQIIGYK